MVRAEVTNRGCVCCGSASAASPGTPSGNEIRLSSWDFLGTPTVTAWRAGNGWYTTVAHADGHTALLVNSFGLCDLHCEPDSPLKFLVPDQGQLTLRTGTAASADPLSQQFLTTTTFDAPAVPALAPGGRWILLVLVLVLAIRRGVPRNAADVAL